MKSIKTLLMSIFFAGTWCLPGGLLRAQQTVVDSALLERIDALEQQVKYKKPGDEHFLVAGLLTFGFVNSSTTQTYKGITQKTSTNSLADADHYEFSPMLLWRHGSKFLLEFEPSFADNQLSVNWADVSYFAAPGLIIRGGYLVLPFGIYNKRLAAGWIGKLATDPLGVADMPPSADFGVEVEGGIQTGLMKWNYDVALSNGMQLLPDGTLQGAGITDNNKNKTVTGRVGWLPFSNSALELGFSFMAGRVGDAGSGFEQSKTRMYAMDLNLVENPKPFQVNLKGQYNVINVNRTNFIDPADSSAYSFDNHTTTGFLQLSVRPMFAEGKLLKNFEIAGRYGNLSTPLYSMWGAKSEAYAVGLAYWLSWRSVIKFTYEGIRTTDRSGPDTGISNGALTRNNSIYLQFSIQL